jgi:hypothetical protein
MRPVRCGAPGEGDPKTALMAIVIACGSADNRVRSRRDGQSREELSNEPFEHR